MEVNRKEVTIAGLLAGVTQLQTSLTRPTPAVLTAYFRKKAKSVVVMLI